MKLQTNAPEHVTEYGFTIVCNVVQLSSLATVSEELGATVAPGTRSMLAVPGIARLARSNTILALLRPYFAHKPIPVRGIFFNKSLDANWLVAWHQDLTIAVRERIDLPGFGPWSVKNGVPHVQPPTELLERMLTVRLNFDDADESNGALRVVPGSHRLGRLTAEQIEQARRESPEVTCCMHTGDVMLMRPLLLHASSRAKDDRPRRVLHLEYADFALPGELNWHESA